MSLPLEIQAEILRLRKVRSTFARGSDHWQVYTELIEKLKEISK